MGGLSINMQVWNTTRQAFMNNLQVHVVPSGAALAIVQRVNLTDLVDAAIASMQTGNLLMPGPNGQQYRVPQEQLKNPFRQFNANPTFQNVQPQNGQQQQQQQTLTPQQHASNLQYQQNQRQQAEMLREQIRQGNGPTQQPTNDDPNKI
mmetsp:Transcript_4606/g.6792  ORF Transcript_4606/g.6792 Transcript_4606/m.6792 type:complete len:149 (-) Transcript_4606:30-476(-)